MFDMAFGDDMIDAGVVDMEVGAAEMALGDPVGGAEMMALGQMDIDAGQNVMDAGLAEAQMGMMGYPMGRVAVDAAFVDDELVVQDRMLITQEQLLMQQRAQIQRAQLNQQQAIQRANIMQRTNQEVIIRREQEAEMLQWQKEQAILQEQTFVQQNIEQEQLRQQQMQRQQEIAREEQFRIQEQEARIRQQQMQLQLVDRQRVQVERRRQQREQFIHAANEEHRIQRQQVSAARMVLGQQRAVDQLQEAKQLQRIQNERLQKQIFNQKKLLYLGKLWRLEGAEWQAIEQATITEDAFVDIPIESITKLKVKAESKIPGTRIIKITTTSQDFFFSVLLEQQAEWMARLIWAKLASEGKSCNINELFQGSIDGEILKKGFFGGWDPKIGAVSGSVFKILPGLDSPAEKTITEVPEVWTRFQIVNGNKLVVKMHHYGFKLEVGVPTERAVGWMRGFFQLVK